MPMDHISLPKSSLLRFSNNGMLNFLDLNDYQIKSSTAKSYNTKPNYYPDEIEQYLSREIETVMGRLHKLLDTFVMEKSTFVYPPNIKEVLVRCFTVQLLRIPKMPQYVKSKSVFSQLLDLPDLYYSPLHQDNDRILNNTIAKMNEYFSGYAANICIVNNDLCTLSFVLPTTHFWGIGKQLFFVLSPHYAFILLPEKENAKHLENDDLQRYISLKNDHELYPIHQKCIDLERTMGTGALIGLEATLLKLKDDLT